MKNNTALSEISNTENLDDCFGCDQYSNIHGGGGHGGRHHRGGGGRGRGWGWGGWGYPYGYYNPYVGYAPPIVYTQQARQIKITPNGLKYLKSLGADTVSPDYVKYFLSIIKDGRVYDEVDLKQRLQLSNWDEILQLLRGKGYINVS